MEKAYLLRNLITATTVTSLATGPSALGFLFLVCVRHTELELKRPGPIQSLSLIPLDLTDIGRTLDPTKDASTFDECYAKHEGNTVDVLHCVTDRIESNDLAEEASLRAWLLVFAGALVFFMQLGFAMLCAGSVRRKNVSNTLLKNLLDACGEAVVFFAVGFAFAFGGQDASKSKTFLGTERDRKSVV